MMRCAHSGDLQQIHWGRLKGRKDKYSCNNGGGITTMSFDSGIYGLQINGQQAF